MKKRELKKQLKGKRINNLNQPLRLYCTPDFFEVVPSSSCPIFLYSVGMVALYFVSKTEMKFEDIGKSIYHKSHILFPIQR